MAKKYTILIKKFNGHFVALCLELNVAAQGESLLEAREELKKAIQEYSSFSKKTKIQTAPLNIETLRDFLMDNIEDMLKVDQDISFAENFSTLIPLYETTRPLK